MVLERPDLLRLHLPQPEELEDRALRVLVHAPLAVVRLGDADLAAVERGDERLYALRVQRTASRISPARRHSSYVGTSAIRQ